MMPKIKSRLQFILNQSGQSVVEFGLLAFSMTLIIFCGAELTAYGVMHQKASVIAREGALLMMNDCAQFEEDVNPEARMMPCIRRVTAEMWIQSLVTYPGFRGRVLSRGYRWQGIQFVPLGGFVGTAAPFEPSINAGDLDTDLFTQGRHSLIFVVEFNAVYRPMTPFGNLLGLRNGRVHASTII